MSKSQRVSSSVLAALIFISVSATLISAIFYFAIVGEWFVSYSWQGQQALHVPSLSALKSRSKLHEILHQVVFKGDQIPETIHDVNLYVLGLADVYYVVSFSVSNQLEFENAVRVISGSPLNNLAESPEPLSLSFASEFRDAGIFPEVWGALEIQAGRYAKAFAADVQSRTIYLKIRQKPIVK